jgi:hypothetical protein
MASDRRSAEDILCIALLHAYAPWLEPNRTSDGVADSVDAVECALVHPPTEDLLVVTRRGPEPLEHLFHILPRHMKVLLHVPDTRLALLAVQTAEEARASHRITLIAKSIAIFQAIARADQRVATGLLTADSDTAREVAHRKLADAILCPPSAADEEVMLLSWDNRIRVYVGVLDTREEILEWIERGADGIRTRYPALLLQSLGPHVIP